MAKWFKRHTTTSEPETSKSKWRTKRDIQSGDITITIAKPTQTLVFNPNAYVSCLNWNYGATNRDTIVYADATWSTTYAPSGYRVR